MFGWDLALCYIVMSAMWYKRGREIDSLTKVEEYDFQSFMRGE
jgi:hypothetical protein